MLFDIGCMQKGLCYQEFDVVFFLFRLLPCVTEHLTAEIVQLTVSDITGAIEWMKCSYLYVRIKKVYHPEQINGEHDLSEFSVKFLTFFTQNIEPREICSKERANWRQFREPYAR